MDNYERRLKYIEANYGLDPLAAALKLQEAVKAGTEDSLLKRGQRRRLHQKHGGSHRNDSPPRSAAERRAMAGGAPGPRPPGVVIDGTRIADLTPAFEDEVALAGR